MRRHNPRGGRHDTGKTCPGAGFDWWHQNACSYVGPNPWYDKGDKRFAPDNILINSREANTFAIIDHKTGRIVWRVGPDYAKGKAAQLGQIIGAHGVHMIPEGLPGEGNILLFDNGGMAGYGAPTEMSRDGVFRVQRYWSRVLEINPVTLEVVWQYDFYKTGKWLAQHFSQNFFSPFVSFAQRLPNGNTIITEGDSGRIIEVTRDYETVWEYISPYNEGHPKVRTLLYRSYRVPYEWVPQLERPEEVSVTPPALEDFVLPNDNGDLPSLKSVLAPKKVIDEEEEDGPMSMHSY